MAINSIGMAAGAAIAGLLADRYGRRAIIAVDAAYFLHCERSIRIGNRVYRALRAAVRCGIRSGRRAAGRINACFGVDARQGERARRRAARKLLGMRLDCRGVNRLLHYSALWLENGFFNRCSACLVCIVLKTSHSRRAKLHCAAEHEALA